MSNSRTQHGIVRETASRFICLLFINTIYDDSRATVLSKTPLICHEWITNTLSTPSQMWGISRSRPSLVPSIQLKLHRHWILHFPSYKLFNAHCLVCGHVLHSLFLTNLSSPDPKLDFYHCYCLTLLTTAPFPPQCALVQTDTLYSIFYYINRTSLMAVTNGWLHCCLLF